MQGSGRLRRFNLTDAAVVVLSTAVGLWAIRDFMGNLFRMPLVLENGRWVKRWFDPVIYLNRAVILEVVLMAWTVGWLAIQLRQPRHRLRRQARQPGFVACFLLASVLLVSGPLTAAALASRWRSGNIPGDYWILFELWSALVSLQAGAAMAAGWALLAVTQTCGVRRGWTDRIGQGFGIVWIAMLPANLILLLWVLL